MFFFSNFFMYCRLTVKASIPFIHTVSLSFICTMLKYLHVTKRLFIKVPKLWLLLETVANV